MFRFTISLLLIAASTCAAQAHWGHVGELAGHGHVIAIGALIGAAALAAALRKPKGETEIEEDELEEEAVGEGELA